MPSTLASLDSLIIKFSLFDAADFKETGTAPVFIGHATLKIRKK